MQLFYLPTLRGSHLDSFLALQSHYDAGGLVVVVCVRGWGLGGGTQVAWEASSIYQMHRRDASVHDGQNRKHFANAGWLVSPRPVAAAQAVAQADANHRSRLMWLVSVGLRADAAKRNGSHISRHVNQFTTGVRRLHHGLSQPP